MAAALVLVALAMELAVVLHTRAQIYTIHTGIMYTHTLTLQLRESGGGGEKEWQRTHNTVEKNTSSASVFDDLFSSSTMTSNE